MFLTDLQKKVSSTYILTLGLMWYPLPGLDGVKIFHLLSLFLIGLSAIKGLIRGLSIPKNYAGLVICLYFLHVFISIWGTVFVPNSWEPIKLLAWLVQILGCYIVSMTFLHNRENLASLFSASIYIFLSSFIVLSGLPILNVIELFIDAIVYADPNIIIFKFLAKAPNFQVIFGEDGVDGFRHTISIYLVVSLILILYFKPKRLWEIVAAGIAFLLILLFQSRSAWLSLFFFILLYSLHYFMSGKMNLRKFMLTVLTILFASIAGYFVMGLMLERLSSTASYDERLMRIDEGLMLIDQFSFTPISQSMREFGSSHIFVFDSYYHSGVLGLLVSILILVVHIALLYPRNLVFDFSYVFASSLIVTSMIRLLTAGSGLAGPGSLLALFAGLAILIMKRKENDHLTYAEETR